MAARPRKWDFRRRERLKRFAGLLLVLFSGAARAASTDLDRLMAALAERQHSHVQFVERQYLALLTEPLESSGELFYSAPDRLEKRTLKPRSESLRLARGILTMERGRRKRVIDMGRFPQFLPFVESIRATLAGERQTLEHMFTVRLDGGLSRWTLRLTPRDADVAAAVLEIRIEGTGTALGTIEIRQPDGDRSVMTISAEITP